jgi:hypothetical protein
MISLRKESVFREIIRLTGQSPRQNPAFLVLNIPMENPRLPTVLRVIRDETGRVPIPHRIMRRTGENAKYFYLWIAREYEEKDVRDLPYVRVQCSRVIADSRDPIQMDDERYLAKANNRLTAHWEYGNLGTLAGYAMTTRLKDLLQQQGMKGFRPRPVTFDKLEKAAKELWQPWSDVMMPRCLLPLVDNAGEPTTPDGLADPIEYTDRPRDPGRGVHYDAGPYISEELCYSAAEVAELGEFDIAIARERVGATKRVAFRPVVISQRFRQALKKEKLPGMQYKPVRLLKKGDPLWENPFESMVGPYEEKPPVADR